MPRLVVLRGEGKGAVYEIDGNVSIGRSSSNPVQITDTHISRLHARIVKKGDRYFLKDTGSRNGVLVNGEPVTEQPLEVGDQIQIGSTVIVFDPEFEMKSLEEGQGGIILLDNDDSSGPMIATPVPPEPTRGREEAPTSVEPPTSKLAMPGAGSNELDVTLRRLKAVYEVTAVASSTLDETQLLGRLLDVVMEIFEAERGAIIFCSEDGGDVTPAAVRRRRPDLPDPTISKTILQQVLKGRCGVLSGDASVDPRFDASRSLRLDNVRSVMCAPLQSKDRVVGALYLDTVGYLRGFGQEDLSLLVNISRQAGIAIENARLYTRTREEVGQLRRKIAEDMAIVGDSPEVEAVRERIRKVASTNSTVLITGETGTGKELVAHAIHQESLRRNKPFVPVDCTAISEHLLESELFGHEKGAFTGADRTKPGKFELANGGTLFLDEIGDMDMSTQQKLLRVLEERSFTRVGGVRLISVDVRIIAATNRNLEEAIHDGKFREDLYYRLAVVPISIPALAERKSDIPGLAQHYLRKFCREVGKPQMELSSEASKLLAAYAWPGNIRELRNLMERVVVLCDKARIEPEDLPGNLRGAEISQEASTLVDQDLPLAEILRQVEKRCILRAMERAKGKKIEVARLLQISRPTLDKKLKEYDLGAD